MSKRLFWISTCTKCLNRFKRGIEGCNACHGTTEIREEVTAPIDDGDVIEIRFYVCRTFDKYVHFLKQEGTYKQWVRDWQKATPWRSEKEAKESAAVSFDCVVEMTQPLCAALGVGLRDGV